MKESKKPLLSIKRVSRFYRKDKPALFDVSVDLFPGEFLYVAGSSGAGKSTLLKLVQRIESPDTGSIHFMDHDLEKVSEGSLPLIRRKMGIVHQDFKLLEDSTLFENVAFPLEVTGTKRSEIIERVGRTLEWVGLGNRENEIVHGLSGGEKQRAGIARAMVHSPMLLLADEPTGNLDAVLADEMMDLFERASSEGTAVILATHDRLLMASRPHRALVLNNGRVVGLSPAVSSGSSLKAVDENFGPAA